MKKRKRAYLYGCCAALFLSSLSGQDLSSAIRQNPTAISQDQGPSLSEILKLPGRVLGRGHNREPVGQHRVTTYLVEVVKLPRPTQVDIRGKTKRVTRAYRVTIYGGPFLVGDLGYVIEIDHERVGRGFGIEHKNLDAVTVVTFERSLLREGATLSISYGGVGRTELPEKLNLGGTKRGCRARNGLQSPGGRRPDRA